MKLSTNKKMTGRELNDAVVSEKHIMYYEFEKMWKELIKAVSYHNIDALDKDAIITFSITWEKGEGE